MNALNTTFSYFKDAIITEKIVTLQCLATKASHRLEEGNGKYF